MSPAYGSSVVATYMAHLPALSQQSHKEVKIVSRSPIASVQAFALTLRRSASLCHTAFASSPGFAALPRHISMTNVGVECASDKQILINNRGPGTAHVRRPIADCRLLIGAAVTWPGQAGRKVFAKLNGQSTAATRCSTSNNYSQLQLPGRFH